VSKLRVNNLCMSVDGYVAGPDQSLEEPLGVNGESLHDWIFADDRDEADGRLWDAGMEGLGAWILGRNMFGPIRGPWGDSDWRGWWGSEPPYHCDVFVLTHHEREPVVMDGGTTFHFVTDGIESALQQAVDAAGDLDVRVGGGASTVRQYLRAGLIDELHIPIVPVLLRGGERLFDQPDDVPPGYEVVELVSSPAVTHLRIARSQ
jgi:dihydrofolate reductase